MQIDTVKLILSCLVAVAPLTIAAQTDTPVSPRIQITKTAGAAEVESIQPAQRIGPGDLLSISVADCPDLTRNFRVSNDGLLVLPLVQQKIRAAGKEPDEIETELSESLVRDGILVRPVVSVSVVEYRSVPVSVLGAVRKPITFQAVGYTTLLDAITKAEGLSPEAGQEVLVSRPAVSASGANNLIQHISLKGLMEDADPTLNIRLYGGEEIRVPPAGKVYVLGNVKKSGAVFMSDDNDTTVMKAIALSEGLEPFYSHEALIYRREVGKKDRKEIPVQIDAIMHHKSPDVHLEANDILYIPDNHGKKVAAETLERLAGFASSTASGLLVFH